MSRSYGSGRRAPCATGGNCRSSPIPQGFHTLDNARTLLTVAHSAGRLAPPLRVVVSPVAGKRSLFGPEPPGAMVFVADPDRHPLPTEEEIRALFGLTAAEARLARALAEGLDVAQAAQRLGQSIVTLRTRLKTIFDRTDTHRQSELIQLIRDWPFGVAWSSTQRPSN